MILCSSISRLRNFIGLSTDSVNMLEHTRLLNAFLHGVSRNIESFLGTKLEITSYTEFFDVSQNQIVFFPKVYPINSITSVHSDFSGRFVGQESEVTGSYIGAQSKSIVLEYPILSANVIRGLKVVYNGGYASHGTLSTFTCTNVSILPGVPPEAGMYVRTLDGSQGIIRTYTSPNILIIDNLEGSFKVGDELIFSTVEGGVSNGATATIATITSQSLVEKFPEIGLACDMQIRFMYKHKDNFEDSSINRDSSSFGTQQFISPTSNIYELRPEVRNMLFPLRRIYLG